MLKTNTCEILDLFFPISEKQQIKHMSTQDKTHTGLDKIERYKWSLKDKNLPGRLEFISKDKLVVDYEYQRKLNHPKSLQIASDFSWMAFGVLTIAHRDGYYSVVDGQHRLAGALKRSDITSVPCIVFDVESVMEEAAGFLNANTLRKPVGAIEKFKALCLCGDSAALAVRKLIEQSGRSISEANDANSVACVSAVLKQANVDMGVLLSTWPLIMELCNGRGVSVFLCRAIWYLENNMVDGQSVGRGRWRERILQVGFEEIDRSIKSSSAYHGSMSPPSCADGILKAINHGLRNRLAISGSTVGATD